uniref:Aminoglycoside phosphotransferase domain-containing protein n=1 Tax=Chlorobium chlorochromatii (strain CaD3) TaxID=340177 RepID=Q3AS99_CHLCH
MINLAEALCHPEAYPHAPQSVEMVQTHCSWVFLAGAWAYKVKKPLDLGFLDFSTLELRRHFCYEELRLNQRLCSTLYLSVVPIVAVRQQIKVIDKENNTDEHWNEEENNEHGTIIDYAVKMVRFDRTQELDRLLAHHKLDVKQMEQLARTIAAFHNSLPAAPMDSALGHPDTIIKPMLHNFTLLEDIVVESEEQQELATLHQATLSDHQRLYQRLLQRKADGFIRQCHGDLHTGNMVMWQGRITLFDCIEFNPTLNTIDCISDLAFLFMDLRHSGETALAWRLLNGYLMETGDYHALALLPFYERYRAMVRAKVTAIHASQSKDAPEVSSLMAEHRSYVAHATNCTKHNQPMLLIVCGLSGSGKSTLAASIASELPAIHLRSDVERKRLAGLRPLERSPKSDLYSHSMTNNTYAHLLGLARFCLLEGYCVVVDATFLRQSNRALFTTLANECNVPYRLLHCTAPKQVLMERVQLRNLEGNDASDADAEVVAMQLEQQEALTDDEKKITITIDTTHPINATALTGMYQLKREH